LFDSGASHDFISSTCAKRAKLALIVAKLSYVISNPGGRVVAKQIAREVLLKLAGQGIDVIQGMSWMKLHKAILDIAK
jgi:hypothetical protein